MAIKKNTKFIFEDNPEKSGDFIGGLPLSVGEEITIIEHGETITYFITDKKITANLDGEDEMVDVTYTVKTK
jgi:hypothetical protein